MAPALIIRGGGVCPLREKLLAVCCNVSTTTQHHDRLDNDHRILTGMLDGGGSPARPDSNNDWRREAAL
jgi:hypothetical protein